MNDEIIEAVKPPAGFEPTPGSKVGSYRMWNGTNYTYWYPKEAEKAEKLAAKGDPTAAGLQSAEAKALTTSGAGWMKPYPLNFKTSSFTMIKDKEGGVCATVTAGTPENEWMRKMGMPRKLWFKDAAEANAQLKQLAAFAAYGKEPTNIDFDEFGDGRIYRTGKSSYQLNFKSKKSGAICGISIWQENDSSDAELEGKWLVQPTSIGIGELGATVDEPFVMAANSVAVAKDAAAWIMKAHQLGGSMPQMSMGATPFMKNVLAKPVFAWPPTSKTAQKPKKAKAAPAPAPAPEPEPKAKPKKKAKTQAVSGGAIAAPAATGVATATPPPPEPSASSPASIIPQAKAAPASATSAVTVEPAKSPAPSLGVAPPGVMVPGHSDWPYQKKVPIPIYGKVGSTNGIGILGFKWKDYDPADTSNDVPIIVKRGDGFMVMGVKAMGLDADGKPIVAGLNWIKLPVPSADVLSGKTDTMKKGVPQELAIGNNANPYDPDSDLSSPSAFVSGGPAIDHSKVVAVGGSWDGVGAEHAFGIEAAKLGGYYSAEEIVSKGKKAQAAAFEAKKKAAKAAASAKKKIPGAAPAAPGYVPPVPESFTDFPFHEFYPKPLFKTYSDGKPYLAGIAWTPLDQAKSDPAAWTPPIIKNTDGTFSIGVKKWKPSVNGGYKSVGFQWFKLNVDEPDKALVQPISTSGDPDTHSYDHPQIAPSIIPMTGYTPMADKSMGAYTAAYSTIPGILDPSADMDAIGQAAVLAQKPAGSGAEWKKNALKSQALPGVVKPWHTDFPYKGMVPVPKYKMTPTGPEFFAVEWKSPGTLLPGGEPMILKDKQGGFSLGIKTFSQNEAGEWVHTGWEWRITPPESADAGLQPVASKYKSATGGTPHSPLGLTLGSASLGPVSSSDIWTDTKPKSDHAHEMTAAAIEAAKADDADEANDILTNAKATYAHLLPKPPPKPEPPKPAPGTATASISSSLFGLKPGSPEAQAMLDAVLKPSTRPQRASTGHVPDETSDMSEASREFIRCFKSSVAKSGNRDNMTPEQQKLLDSITLFTNGHFPAVRDPNIFDPARSEVVGGFYGTSERYHTPSTTKEMYQDAHDVLRDLGNHGPPPLGVKPNSNGETWAYRGLKCYSEYKPTPCDPKSWNDMLAALQPGSEFTEMSPASYTLSYGVADDWAGSGQHDAPSVVVIQLNPKGVWVKPFSRHDNEDEVIQSPTDNFVVMARKDVPLPSGKTKVYIFVAPKS